MKNTSERFGGVAQTLHWVIALLIIVQFVLANYYEDAAERKAFMEQIAWMARHKSFGILILSLAVLRLGWRFANPVPKLPETMASWQVRATHVSHFLFYFLLFYLPITGWMMSSAANFPVAVFDLFTLPNLVGPSEEIKDAMMLAHEIGVTTLWVLAIVHVAAALKHHFVDKDNVLRRMVPFMR